MNKDQTFSLKSHVITKAADITDKDMELINKHTRRELTKEEVYIFPISMCDNEGDRDHEYFDISDLKKLGELFVGKTFIQDHNWSSGNQHSRIFKTEVETVKDEVVKSSTKLKGQPYNRLVGYAYTIRKGNEFLIEQIEGGILKEVSVGFRVSDLECDICSNSFYDGEKCNHYPGREYDNEGKKQTCYLHMKNPTEAFEVSFVAVPAQPQAGVIKGVKIEELKKGIEENSKYKKTERSIFYANLKKRGDISMEKLKDLVIKAKAADSDVIEIPVADLEKDLGVYEEAVEKATDVEGKLKAAEPLIKMGETYIDDMKKECTRLGKMAEGDSFNEEVMKSVFEKCDIEELKAFQKQYQSKVDELYPPTPQVKTLDDKKEHTDESTEDNSSYK